MKHAVSSGAAPASSTASPEVIYRQRLADRQAALNLAERQGEWLGNARLGLALVALVLILLPLFVKTGEAWWGLLPVVSLFIGLGKFQDRVFDRTRRLEGSLGFYRDGLARFEERWRELPDDGEDLGVLQRAKVHYADDLDLFGPASVYQLFSRATTSLGRRTLGRWLVTAESREEIGARQAAVLELIPALDFREALVTASAGESGARLDDERLLHWAEASEVIPFSPGLRFLGIFQPAVLLISGGFFLLGGHPAPLAVAAIAQGLTLILTRTISGERADVLSGPERVLNRYAQMIATVEGRNFTSPRLVELRSRLVSNGHSASKSIRSLHWLVDLLDARLNMFFALTIGPALLWNLNLVLRAEDWRRRAGPRLRGWLEVLAEFEALSSFAAVGYERTDYSMPVLKEGPLTFEAEQLAHPLIDRAVVVANDLTLAGPSSVLLLSGSNMSGKSTLLRAVGVNIVLAQAGAPVAAKRLTITPIEPMTSVRIVDSLAKGTSHFYAEIQRLKLIVDAVRNPGRPVLYLLDEVLHGTNSRERYIGAVAVIRWLSKAGAVGIVTTHDLALTKLEGELGKDRVRNCHLSDDVDVGGEKIRFDYRLREGPVVSTNALRLMRSIGMDLDFDSVTSLAS
ncbi:MAG: DNA mismatch repair protein MutS [Deltaproteobacteria bacterium]|nr:DNA mismatch repair protein MutS [Deltaproteobacteria bacterium]